MILKYCILALLCVFFITASDPYFGTEFSFQPIPKESPDDVKERTWMSTDAFRKYLEDHDDRVDNVFRVSKFFYPNVNFWFLIYTQFESSSVLIHDKENLTLIYKVLDFSHLYEKTLSKNALYVLQGKITDEKVDNLKETFDRLIKEPFSHSLEAKNIYATLKRSKVHLPASKNDRVSFFKKLRNNIRTQTGQKNFIRDGIFRSQPYQKFLGKYFSDRKLPIELLAIPFLESSFNPRAHSKANALGIWQFMPLIASYYMPKRNLKTDYRYNVGISSVGAGFLMSENISIMKNWDLAVTAYNSGTKHLLKTKRELGSKSITLEEIVRHSKSNIFGFASKNFYSEFLALAHVLAYKEELFDNVKSSDRDEDEDKDELKFFMLKCSLRLSKELNNDLLKDVNFHNHHIHTTNESLPRGYIITAKGNLPRNKFLEISYGSLLKTKPKDWDRYLKGQSCSTR